MHIFQLNIKALKTKIKIWNKKDLGNIFEAKIILKGQMQFIQHGMIMEGRSPKPIEEEGSNINKLEQHRQQEEILLKKESKIQCLKEGEKNSKLFHNCMLQRCHNNQIFSILGAYGDRRIVHHDIEKELMGYYQGILT